MGTRPGPIPPPYHRDMNDYLSLLLTMKRSYTS
jgi:hypothetical protein